MPALASRNFAPRLRGLRAAPLLLVLGRFRPKTRPPSIVVSVTLSLRLSTGCVQHGMPPVSGDRNRLFGGSESPHRGIGIACGGQL